MSMIENEKYDQFKAEGALTISDMALETADLPEVKISSAAFAFNPAFAELRELKMRVGERSDFALRAGWTTISRISSLTAPSEGSLDLTSASVDLMRSWTGSLQTLPLLMTPRHLP